MHDEGQNSQNWGFEIPNKQREFRFHDTKTLYLILSAFYSLHIMSWILLSSINRNSDMTCMIPATMLPPPTPMEEVYNVNIDDPVSLLQRRLILSTIQCLLFPE